MIKQKIFGFIGGASILLSACAIHPLPEQIARDTTYEIVYKIQCEGREALDRLIVRYFRVSKDPQTVQLANDIESGDLFARDLLKPKYFAKIDEGTKVVLGEFTLSSAVFDFRFKITETNDNMLNANFRMPFLSPSGTFTLGVKGGKKLERTNERKVQVGSTFFALHGEEYDPTICEKRVAKTENMIYPITGKIGLEEVFDTFVKLSLLTKGLGHENSGTQKKTEKFVDVLTFTTTLSSSATPKIELAPIADINKFRLADASGTFGNNRVDIHEVTIAVAKGEPGNRRSLLAALEEGRKEGLDEAFITATRERDLQALQTIFRN